MAGLSSNAFRDTGWVREHCTMAASGSEAGSVHTINYISAPTPTTITTTLMGPQRSVDAEATATFSCGGTLDTSTGLVSDVDVSVDFLTHVNAGAIEGSGAPSQTITATGHVSRGFTVALPVDAGAVVSTRWFGSLVAGDASADGGAAFIEKDLFDDRQASVALPLGGVPATSATNALTAANFALTWLAQPADRIDAMGAPLTDIPDATHRAAYLNVTALPTLSLASPSVVQGGMILPPGGGSDSVQTFTSGVHLYSTASCSDAPGSTACPSAILETLRDEIVAKAPGLDAHCPAPTLVPGSLESSIGVDLFSGTSASTVQPVIVPGSTHVYSSAVFDCGDSHYVGVGVGAKAAAARTTVWPVKQYINPLDTESTNGMTEAVRFVPYGTLTGLHSPDLTTAVDGAADDGGTGAVYTLQASNLFGASHGGVVTRAQPVDAGHVASTLTAMRGALDVGNDKLMAETLDALFRQDSPTAATELVDAYSTTTAVTAMTDFWSYFAEQEQERLQLHMAADGSNFTLTLLVTAASTRTISDDVLHLCVDALGSLQGSMDGEYWCSQPWWSEVDDDDWNLKDPLERMCNWVLVDITRESTAFLTSTLSAALKVTNVMPEPPATPASAPAVVVDYKTHTATARVYPELRTIEGYPVFDEVDIHIDILAADADVRGHLSPFGMAVDGVDRCDDYWGWCEYWGPWWNGDVASGWVGLLRAQYEADHSYRPDVAGVRWDQRVDHPPDLVPGIREAANELFQQLTKSANVNSLGVDFGTVRADTALTIADMVRSLEAIAAGTADNTGGFAIAGAMEAALEAHSTETEATVGAPNTPVAVGSESVTVSATVVPYGTCQAWWWWGERCGPATELEFEVTVRIAQWLTLDSEAAGFKYDIASNRVRIPVVSETRAGFTVFTTDQNEGKSSGYHSNSRVDYIVVDADAVVRDFAAPMTTLMQVGTNDGDARITIAVHERLDSTDGSSGCNPESKAVVTLASSATMRDTGRRFNLWVDDDSNKLCEKGRSPPPQGSYGRGDGTRAVVVRSGSATEAAAGVSPDVVQSGLTALLRGTLPAALLGVLNERIPPMGAPYDAVSELPAIVERLIIHIGSWFSTRTTVPLITSATRSCRITDATQKAHLDNPFFINATINKHAHFACPVPAPGVDSVQQIIDDVQAAMQQCGLSQYVVARLDNYGVKDQVASDLECGTIGLHARFPGAVWDAEFSTETYHKLTPVVFAGKYTRQVSPKFTSWPDAARFLHVTMAPAEPYVPPQRVDLPVETLVGVIPDALRAVYPPAIPSVVIASSFSFHETPTGAELLEALDGGGEHHDSVSMVVNASAAGTSDIELTLASSLSTLMAFGFDLPPTGPSFVTSNMVNGYSYFNTSVPKDGNNTFQLDVALEQRFVGGGVTTVEYHTSITLAPGMRFDDALHAAIPSQLPAALQGTVSLDVTQCIRHNPYCAPQLAINVSSHQEADGSWLLPVSVGVSKSMTYTQPGYTYPLFHNVTAPRKQYRGLYSQLHLQVDAALTAHTFNAAGGVGLVGATTVGAHGGGVSHTSIDQLPGLWHTMEKATSSLRHNETFGDVYTATVGVQSDMHLPLALNVDRIDIPGVHHVGGLDNSVAPAEAGDTDGEVPKALFAIDTVVTLGNAEGQHKFGQLVDYLAYDLAFTGPPALVKVMNQLLKTDYRSVCSVSNLVLDASTAIADHDFSVFPLPFSGMAFGDVQDSVWTDTYRALTNNICKEHEGMSVAVLCAVAQEAFGKDVCKHAILTPDSLEIAMNISLFDVAVNDRFVLDLTQYFAAGKKAHVPVGMSEVGSMLAHADAHVFFDQVVRFGGGPADPVEFDLKDAGVQMAVSFDAQGSLDAQFGPLSVVFGNARVQLGSPATFTAQLIHADLGGADADGASSSKGGDDKPRALQLVDGRQILVVNGGEGRSGTTTQSLVAGTGRVTGSAISKPLKFEMAVDGFAHFYARANMHHYPYCSMNITVTNLADFFSPATSKALAAVEHDVYLCGEEVVNSMEEWIEEHNLFHELQDAKRVVQQLEASFASLLDNLFAPGGVIAGLALPLVERDIAEALLTREIQGIIGPAADKAMVSALDQFTSGILMNGTAGFNYTTLEQAALDAFTFILCEVTHPTTCPAAPKAGAKEYLWPLLWGKTTKEPRKGLNWELGKHGAAELEFEVEETMAFGWEVQATLNYTQKDGFHLSFPKAPVVGARFDITLDAASSSLFGAIGFWAVDFRPRGGMHANIAVMPPPADLQHNNPHEHGRGRGLRELPPRRRRLHGGKAKGWTVVTDIGAILAGDLEMGLKTTHGKIDVVNDVIPHADATLNMTWTFNKHTMMPNTPTFRMTNIQFCVGTFMAHMLSNIIHKADSVLGPLKHLYGPDGLFLRNVPLTPLIMGRQMTVIELMQALADDYCDGDCVFEGAVEALETFGDIYEDLEKFETILTFLRGNGTSGCGGLSRAIHAFEVDFDSDKPQPHWWQGKGHGGTSWNPPAGWDGGGGGGKSGFDDDWTNPNWSQGGGPEPVVPEEEAWAFPDGMEEAHKTFVQDTYNAIGLHHRAFGIKFNLFQDLGTLLFEMLLGLPLIGDILDITLPPAVVAVFTHWPFYIYPFPEVILEIMFGLGVAVDISKIGVTYQGIYDALKSHNLGLLTNAIYTPLVDPVTKAPLYPIKGFISVGASLIISILIFEGGVSATLTLWAGLTIQDMFGDGRITLDELWWLIKNDDLLKALKVHIELDATFSFFIRACIPFPFDEMCWTVIQENFEFPIFALDMGHNPMPQLMQHGVVNYNLGDIGGGGKGVVYTVFDAQNVGTTVAIKSAEPGGRSSSPVTSRRTPITMDQTSFVEIEASGDVQPDDAPLHVIVRDLKLHRYVAPLQATSLLEFDHGSYPAGTTVRVSSGGITPSIGRGMRVQTGAGGAPVCGTMQLQGPVGGSDIAVTGVPCRTLLNLTRSNATLSGDPNDFVHGTLDITGSARTLNSRVLATQVHVTDTALVAGTRDAPALVNVAFTESTRDAVMAAALAAGASHAQATKAASAATTLDNVIVTCHHSESCTGNIESNPEGRRLLVQGGPPPDQFSIDDATQHHGPTKIDGGGGTDFLWVGLRGQIGAADQSYSTTLSQNAVSHRTAGSNHTITHRSITQFTLNMTGSEHAHNHLHLSYAMQGTQFVIHSHKPTTTGRHDVYVSGCDIETNVRLHATGPGDHVFHIGSGNMSDFNCNFGVYGDGSSAQNVTLVFDGSTDPRPLHHTLRAGEYRMEDPVDVNNLFTATHTNVHNVLIKGSRGGNTVTLDHDAEVEYQTAFDFGTAAAGDVNQVKVAGDVRNSVAMLGDVHYASVGVAPQVPLASLSAPLVFGNTANVETVIRLVSAAGEGAPEQRYRIDDLCFNGLDLVTGHRVVPPVIPGKWFCDTLTAAGMPVDTCDRKCHIGYAGKTAFYLRTGVGADELSIVGAKARVIADLGKSSDLVLVGHTNAVVEITTGLGADNVILAPPLGPTTVDFVDSGDLNTVTVYNDETKFAPTEGHGTISGVGSGEDHSDGHVSLLNVKDDNPTQWNPVDAGHILDAPPDKAVASPTTQEMLRQAIAPYGKVALMTAGKTPLAEAMLSSTVSSDGAQHYSFSTCGSQPFHYVLLEGSGHKDVAVGDADNRVTASGTCALIVEGSKATSQHSVMTVNAHGESSFLRVNSDRNTLGIISPRAGRDLVNLVYINPNIMVVNLASAGNDLLISQGTMRTESVFNVPELTPEATAAGDANTAAIRCAVSATAISGHVHSVKFGVDSQQGIQVNPMKFIDAPVVLDIARPTSPATAPPGHTLSPVLFTSATGPDADHQNYYIVRDAMYATEADNAQAPRNPVYWAMSDQFCETIQGYGFGADICRRNFTLAFQGAMSLNITAGDNSNCIQSFDVAVPQSVVFGTSPDVVTVAGASAPSTIDAGKGPDSIMVSASPWLRVSAGVDDDIDTISVCTGDGPYDASGREGTCRVVTSAGSKILICDTRADDQSVYMQTTVKPPA